MAESESAILIVDDDAEDLSALKGALESLGCELHTVSDPHNVLPAVYRERPDVVVLDALLPGLSGFDLCKQIKTDGELKGIQVVIITGVYLRQQYRQEALQQFKADGFLTKPFRAPELQRLVVELLSKKTRKPQSTFLSRLGLPAASPVQATKKRGLFGRLFGKDEEESASTRIAAAPRGRVEGRSQTKPARKSASASAAEESLPKSEDTSMTVPGVALPAATAAVQDVAPPAIQTEETASDEPLAAANDEARPATPPEESASLEDTSSDVESAKAKSAIQLPESTDGDTTDEPAAESKEASEDLSERPEAEGSKTATVADAPAAVDPADETPSHELDGAQSAKTQAVGALGLDDAPVDDSGETMGWTTEKPRPAPVSEPPADHGISAELLPESTTEQPEAKSKHRAEEEPKVEEKPKAEEKAREEDKPEAEEPATEDEPEARDVHDRETTALGPIGVLKKTAVQRPHHRVDDVPVYDEEDFHLELKRELSKCRRVDRPLTLIVVRVGDLTQIVELFGDEIREPVLWHVAEQAMGSLREVDLVGMISSKNLVALTAFASDKYGGGRVVARMRKSVNKYPFRVSEEMPPIVPALEFGMSSYPDDGADAKTLMSKALDDISR